MGTSCRGLLDRAECQGLLHNDVYGADTSSCWPLIASGRTTTMRRLRGPTLHDNLPRGGGAPFSMSCCPAAHFSHLNASGFILLRTWQPTAQVDLDLKDRGRIPGYFEQDKKVLKAYQVRNCTIHKSVREAISKQIRSDHRSILMSLEFLIATSIRSILLLTIATWQAAMSLHGCPGVWYQLSNKTLHAWECEIQLFRQH